MTAIYKGNNKTQRTSIMVPKMSWCTIFWMFHIINSDHLEGLHGYWKPPDKNMKTSGHHFKGILAVKKICHTHHSKSYEFFKLFSFNMQFFSSWWLNQPVWKNMLLKMWTFPKWGEHIKSLKPPPRNDLHLAGKKHHLKMYLRLKLVIFHCHDSFWGGVVHCTHHLPCSFPHCQVLTKNWDDPSFWMVTKSQGFPA